MTNVVELRPEPPDCIWRCNCGCITFRAHVDQTLECAQCGGRQDQGGEWVKESAPERPVELKAGEAEARNVVTMQKTAAMMLRDLAGEKDGDDFVFVLAVRKSGKHTLWGGSETRIETEQQLNWLERQFDIARSMMVKVPRT